MLPSLQVQQREKNTGRKKTQADFSHSGERHYKPSSIANRYDGRDRILLRKINTFKKRGLQAALLPRVQVGFFYTVISTGIQWVGRKEQLYGKRSFLGFITNDTNHRVVPIDIKTHTWDSICSGYLISNVASSNVPCAIQAAQLGTVTGAQQLQKNTQIQDCKETFNSS